MKIFHLPDLGEGLAEAEIHEWYIHEGDVVKVDQPMVSMETAKAVVDVPAPRAGKIIKLYGKTGDIIATHAPLVEFEEGEVEKPKDQGTVVGSLEENNSVLAEGEMIIGAAKKTTATIKAMPAVRALAKQFNIDLHTLTASGRAGEITLEDVKKAAQRTRLSGNVEMLQGVRRFMATAMTQSHAKVVPVTIVDDADVTDNQRDFTTCLLQAMTAAAKAEPSLNAWYDDQHLERCLHNEVHIGLAMDTEEGLFVPVLKNVDKKTPQELRAQINVFKESVRNRSIAAADLQGATLTLSNFGTLAGRYANPIVIPPTVAILGCGKIREEVRVYQGKIAMRRMVPLSLTVDHRVVTGGEATRFLAAVIHYLENNR